MGGGFCYTTAGSMIDCLIKIRQSIRLSSMIDCLIKIRQSIRLSARVPIANVWIWKTF